MLRRVAVRGVIVHNGKLFCSRAKPYNRNVDTSIWCAPGGGIDDGEPLMTGLEREIIEELGIKPMVGNLLYIQQFVNKINSIEQLEFFFHINNSADYLNVDLAKTSHGHIEIAELGFVNPADYPVLPEFLKTEPFDNIASQSVKTFSYL